MSSADPAVSSDPWGPPLLEPFALRLDRVLRVACARHPRLEDAEPGDRGSGEERAAGSAGQPGTATPEPRRDNCRGRHAFGEAHQAAALAGVVRLGHLA